MPPELTRPEPPQPPPPKSTLGTLAIVASCALVVCVVSLFLPLIGLMPVLVIVGLLFVGGLNYLLWGRWLTRVLQDEQRDDESPPR